MLHTRLCDLLGIKHPIISAPMAGSPAPTWRRPSRLLRAGHDRASFASPDWLREQIDLVHQRTDKPFAAASCLSARYRGADGHCARIPRAGDQPRLRRPDRYIQLAAGLGLKTMVQVDRDAGLGAAQTGADVIAA